VIAWLTAALVAAAIPQGDAVYRFEIAGRRVGAATLEVHCDGTLCSARWSTRMRLPEEAGGELSSTDVTVAIDPTGRSLGDRTRIVRDGAARTEAVATGSVPAMIAPLLLSDGAPRELGRCVDAFDEETAERGLACVEQARKGRRQLEVMGVAMAVAPGADGFPDAIDIPVQRARWVRDPSAAPPSTPPRLFGVRLPGPAGRPVLCGADPDPAPGAAAAGIPAPSATGKTCRERTLDWLARAARAGFMGRVAVGAAFDGVALAWHAWAEVRSGGSWIAVDPTFGQLPARGPRFTVARYDPANPAERLAAGRRLLECWMREGSRATSP